MSSVVVVSGYAVMKAMVAIKAIATASAVGAAMAAVATVNAELLKKKRFEENKRWFRLSFDRTIAEVEARLKEVRFDKKLAAEALNDLKDIASQGIAKYNIEWFESQYHDKMCEKLSKTFSDKALEIKYQAQLWQEDLASMEKVQTNADNLIAQLENSAVGKETIKRASSKLERSKSEAFDLKERKENLEEALKLLARAKEEKTIIKSLGDDKLVEEKIERKSSKTESLKALIVSSIDKLEIIAAELGAPIKKERELAKEAQSLKADDRLKLIKDSLRVKLGSLRQARAWTDVYKDELKTLLAAGVINDKIKEEIRLALTQKIIDKKQFERLSHISAFDQNVLNEDVITLAGDLIEKLGYNRAKSEDSAAYFDLNDEGYKLLFAQNKEGDLAFRVIREVGSEKELKPNAYQLQRDQEVAAKWCGDFDRLKETLKDSGIVLTEKLRITPENQAVEYRLKPKQKIKKQKSGAELKI
ncbi:MAG: hypothetical protein LBP89_05055 [Helicobacteraceae bacterium]|jgi:hypothetical protein|nr:hypothetical protein [Helicobacteraceae bacterium]